MQQSTPISTSDAHPRNRFTCSRNLPRHPRTDQLGVIDTTTESHPRSCPRYVDLLLVCRVSFHRLRPGFEPNPQYETAVRCCQCPSPPDPFTYPTHQNHEQVRNGNRAGSSQIDRLVSALPKSCQSLAADMTKWMPGSPSDSPDRNNPWLLRLPRRGLERVAQQEEAPRQASLLCQKAW